MKNYQKNYQKLTFRPFWALSPNIARTKFFCKESGCVTFNYYEPLDACTKSEKTNKPFLGKSGTTTMKNKHMEDCETAKPPLPAGPRI